MLESTVKRIERHLRRRGLLRIAEEGGDPDVPGDPESNLAASAVSGQTPPAGPQWVRGLTPLEPHALAYGKPLCASFDGFTLHAATRAGALDMAGREALLRYVLRPPIAQERLEQRPDGLLRTTLKKAYTDGTVAVDMDPLSLQLPGTHEAAGDDRGAREHRPALAAVGEATEVPRRSPSRGPAYWKSQVFRRQVLGDEDSWGSQGSGADEVA